MAFGVRSREKSRLRALRSSVKQVDCPAHEFVAQGKLALIERHQLADMEWAVEAAATRL